MYGKVDATILRNHDQEEKVQEKRMKLRVVWGEKS